MKNLRSRAMWLFTIILLVIAGGFISFTLIQQQRIKQIQIKNSLDEASIKAENLLNRSHSIFIQKIRYFMNNENLIEQFKLQDKENLFKKVLPYYSILKTENPYHFEINFFTPEGNLLLNMNEPWQKNKLYRTNGLLSECIENKKSREGVQLTTDGLFYKIVKPVKQGKNLIGYIELGIRDLEMMREFNEEVGVVAFPYFNKKRILNEDKFKDYGGVSLNTLHYRFGDEEKFFNDILSKNLDYDEQSWTQIGDNYFNFRNLSELGYSKYLPDGIVFAINTTSIVKEYQSYVYRIVVLTSTMFLLFLSITFLLIRKFGRNVNRLHSTIDSKVDERTRAFMDSNSELNLIFNNTADGIILIDKEKTIQKVNKTYCEITGFAENEILGKKCFEFFPCKECHSTKCVLERLHRGEEKIERDIEYMPKKEGKFPCIQTSIPIRDEEGEIIGVLENFKDVTKRKEVEEALKRNEKQFSKFIDYLPLAVFIKDKNSRILHVNKYVKEYLLNESDIGKLPEEIFDYETSRRIREEDQWVLVRGYTVLEETLKNKEGKDNIFLTHKFKMYGYGNSVQIGGISLDITKRKHAEEQLRVLSNAIQQSPVSVLITNRFGVIEFVNDSFCEITGYEYAEVINKHSKVVRAGHHHNDFYKQMWRSLNTGCEWKGELQNQKRNGDLYWVSATISPIRNAEDEITHFVAIMEDISIRKEHEDELMKAKVKAEESDRLKSSFLANMSHEIRTPLNAIVGFSEILCTQAQQFDDKSVIHRHITENSQTLLKLIEDIIDVSKIESGQIKIHKRVCLLNRLLADVFEHFDKKINQVRHKKVNFFMSHPLDDQLCVLTDSNRLKQIIFNLIENAYKFTNSGFIEFGYTLRENEILFYVIDTGIGIPGKDQTRIFEHFRQVDGSQSREFGGNGLGLAIAQHFTRLLGGNIWVDSSPEVGSTFYFTIPLEEVEFSEELQRIVDEKPNFDWRNKRILVAEDTDANFDLIKAALRNTNAEIFWAKNGREAVEMCEKIDKLDLVLMDLNMPEMNGYEATRQIKSKHKDLPIIGQSSFFLQTNNEQEYENAFDAYVPKPIHVENLMDLMEEYMLQ